MRAVDLCPSAHLEAVEIGDKLGDEKVVTIARIEIESNIGADKVTRGVIFFNEFKRGMVVNKTKRTMLTNIFESGETDDWIGKKITLYRSETPYEGEVRPCICVRAVRNK